MSAFIEARDKKGAAVLCAVAQIKTIHLPEDDEDFGEITMTDDERYQAHRDELDKLTHTNDRRLPAASGWLLAEWEHDHRERPAGIYGPERLAITPCLSPVIGWRVYASGEVEPVTPSDHQRRAYEERRHDGGKFARDLVAISPEGRGFVVGGQNDDGLNFSQETTLPEWASAYFEDRREDASRRERDAERLAKRRACK